MTAITDLLSALGHHGPYILASYGVVGVGLVGLFVQSVRSRNHWRRLKTDARSGGE